MSRLTDQLDLTIITVDLAPNQITSKTETVVVSFRIKQTDKHEERGLLWHISDLLNETEEKNGSIFTNKSSTNLSGGGRETDITT